MPLYTSAPPFPPVSSVSEGVNATPAGTQITSFTLVSRVNRVTVVATLGDAVRLPVFLTDGTIDVSNDSATALSVFPYEATSMVGNLAAGVGYSVAAGKDCRFIGTGTYGRWLPIQSA